MAVGRSRDGTAAAAGRNPQRWVRQPGDLVGDSQFEAETDQSSAPAFGPYGPRSEAWQLNREATMLLGAGPRALLLQIAHPLIAEGVDQHSDFRREPWKRLEATLRSYLRIVYGTQMEARDEIDRLGRLHRQVRGPVVDPAARGLGRSRYSALDPELSLWVHATLIDSTIVAFDRWIQPLAPARRARFYDETRPVGLAFGIPDSLLPAGYAAFQDYLDAMLAPGGPIRVPPTARALSETILHPPLGPLVPPGRLSAAIDLLPPAAYDWLLWPAVALLPERVRVDFGIPWTLRRRLTSAWLVAGFQAWRPLMPPSFRWMPQAIAADRRVDSWADRGTVRGGGRMPSVSSRTGHD